MLKHRPSPSSETSLTERRKELLTQLVSSSEVNRPAIFKIFVVVFFLVFGGAFTYLSYTQIRGLALAYDTGSWVSVEGHLEKWDVRVSRSSKSTSTQYTAQYTYDYQGSSYTSTRIAPVHQSSNFDSDFKSRIRNIFMTADVSDKKISVWVNPKKPQESVLIRDMSLALSAFTCFFLVFPCAMGSLLFLSAITYVGEWLGSTTIRHRIWYVWCLYHGGIAWLSLAAGANYGDSPIAVLLLIAVGCIWPFGWWKLYTKSKKRLSESA